MSQTTWHRFIVVNPASDPATVQYLADNRRHILANLSGLSNMPGWAEMYEFLSGYNLKYTHNVCPCTGERCDAAARAACRADDCEGYNGHPFPHLLYHEMADRLRCFSPVFTRLSHEGKSLNEALRSDPNPPRALALDGMMAPRRCADIEAALLKKLYQVEQEEPADTNPF